MPYNLPESQDSRASPPLLGRCFVNRIHFHAEGTRAGNPYTVDVDYALNSQVGTNPDSGNQYTLKIPIDGTYPSGFVPNSYEYTLYGTLPGRSADPLADEPLTFYNKVDDGGAETTFHWSSALRDDVHHGGDPLSFSEHTSSVDPSQATFSVGPNPVTGSPPLTTYVRLSTEFALVYYDDPAAAVPMTGFLRISYSGSLTLDLTWKGDGYPCAPGPRFAISHLKALDIHYNASNPPITTNPYSFLEGYSPPTLAASGFPQYD